MLQETLTWITNETEYHIKNLTKNYHYEILDTVTLLDDLNNTEIFPIVLEILKNVKNDVHARYFASKIIRKQITLNPSILNNDLVKSDLIIVALNNEITDIKIKRCIFQSLKTISGNLSDDFYEIFFKNLKQFLYKQSYFHEGSAFVKLEKYIKSKSNNKFNVLYSLLIALSESSNEITFEIFNNFPETEWCLELLMYALLSKVLHHTQEWNVSAVQNFIQKLHYINNLITEKCKIEAKYLLELLINRENEIQYDLQKMNDLLTLLLSSEQSLDIITNNSLDFGTIIEKIKVLWLEARCNHHQITYTENELFTLKSLLHYSIDVLDSVFEKIKPHTEMSQLITFFSLLNKNDFKLISKNYFLYNYIPHCKSLDYWKKQLFFYLIENIIRNEFVKYDYTLVQNKENVARNIKYNPYFFEWSIAGKTSHTVYNNEFQISEKNKLKCFFESEQKKEWLNLIMNDLNQKLSEVVMSYGWTMEEVKRLIQSLDNENKIIQLVKALKVIIEYRINNKDNRLFNIILQSNLTNVEKNIYKIAINETSSGTYEKSFDQLLKELLELNVNEDISRIQKSLIFHYKSVIAAYNERSRILLCNSRVNEWNETNIEYWSSNLKKFDNQFCSEIIKYEALAVIYRAVELTCRIQPRDIQLLSVILFLFTDTNKGRLAQISTGEGKTTIIAMIAAYHALNGHKVDIITSSPVLALPQSKQQEKFYTTFGLTVSCNSNNNHRSYYSDIVYGAANDFQADILRQEYKKMNVRCHRECDIAIVDEVDSMLIDGNNHIVKLTESMPAMDHLEPILGAIYVRIKILARSIEEKDGKTYYVNMNDKTRKEHSRQIVHGTKIDFIKEETEKYMRKLIRSHPGSIPEDFPEIEIPKHLREFICEVQLKNWIEQAVLAIFYYVNGKHYILKDDKILVVDANNTGTIQKNMQWSCGLHQFLQIKHGAKIQPETLTTNFMSNVSFFKKYSSNLYGLTGTLGSNVVKQLLQKTYNVDSIIIPSFKLKQYKELSTIVVYNENDWYKEIIRSCLLQLHNNRAVLIITNYIKETEKLRDIFIKDCNYQDSKVLTYKTNDDVKIVDQILRSGDVLITTNIAGRGADIKVSGVVNNNGGLHVCLTFLPVNSRVEDQNKGRTGRTGNPGTSQVVLLSEIENIDITDLKSTRDLEEERFIEMAEKEVDIVINKDAIFFQFCHLLYQIKGRNSMVRETEMIAVEERFAIWMILNSNKIEIASKEDIMTEFKLFKNEILQDDQSGNLIKNPYLYIKIGNKYMDCKKFKDAINEYTSAIRVDKNFAEYAYFNRGVALIAEYGKDIKNINIDLAIEDFKNARNLIKRRESNLQILQICSSNKVFVEQLSNKFNLYRLQKEAIDEAIGSDAQEIEKEIEQLEKSGKSKEILKKIEALKKIKEKVGVVKKAKDDNVGMNIEFIEIEKCIDKDDISLHTDEINEFKSNGFVGTFKITKKVNWWKVIGIFIIGAIQLIGGILLTIFTGGILSEVGLGLITEGVGDFCTAIIDGIINGSLDWSTWAIQKGLSLLISVATCAVKIGVQAAKSACHVAKNVATTTGKFTGNVASKIGSTIATKLGCRLVPSLTSYVFENQLAPMIQEKIIESIKTTIDKALMENPMVKQMLALDEKNNDQKYENMIKCMAHDILSQPNNTEIRNHLLKTGASIASSLSTNDLTTVTVSMIPTITAAAFATHDLMTFSSKFINQLNEKIDIMAKEDKIDEMLNVTTLESHQHAPMAYNCLNLNVDIDISKVNEIEEQVKQSDKTSTLNTLSKALVNEVSKNMLNIIRGTINLDSLENDNCKMKKSLYSIDPLTINYSENESRKLQEQITNIHDNIVIRQVTECDDDGKKNELQEQLGKRINAFIGYIYYECKLDIHVHLAALSYVIEKPIEIYDQNKVLKYVIGANQHSNPIKIQFYKSDEAEYLSSMEDEEKYRKNYKFHLYNIVAAQLGNNPEELILKSKNLIKTNPFEVAKQVFNIKRLELYQNMKVFINTHYSNIKCDEKFVVNINRTVEFVKSKEGCSKNCVVCQCKASSYKKFVCKYNENVFHLYDIKDDKICINMLNNRFTHKNI